MDIYQRLNRIAEGTYGVVFRAREKTTGKIKALKQVHTPLCGQRYFKQSWFLVLDCRKYEKQDARERERERERDNRKGPLIMVLK